MMTAFNGNEAVKAAAMEEATGPQATAWAVEANDDERAQCAERFGLAPALLALLSHGFHVPYGERALEKLAAALKAVPAGADSLAIVRTWVLQIWARDDGPSRQIRGTPLEKPALQIIELIKRSATENVGRDEWRRARALVNQCAGGNEALAPFAELLAAMAWDLKASPRAVIDIWNAWSGTVTVPLNDAAGFPQHKQDEVTQAIRECHVAASEVVGAHDAAKESEQAYGQRMSEALMRLIEERGFSEAFTALQHHFAATLGPAMQAWQTQAEASITSACARGGH